MFLVSSLCVLVFPKVSYGTGGKKIEKVRYVCVGLLQDLHSTKSLESDRFGNAPACNSADLFVCLLIYQIGGVQVVPAPLMAHPNPFLG